MHDLQREVETWRLQMERQQAHRALNHTCVVYWDEDVTEGITCEVDTAHLMCKDCFNRDVKEACSDDNIAGFKQAKQQIPCRMCSAAAGGGVTGSNFKIAQLWHYLEEDTLLVI